MACAAAVVAAAAFAASSIRAREQPSFGGAQDPAWSPDGSRLALSFYERIGVVSRDGRGGRLLTEWGRTAPVERDPAWSPDGKRLAFAADAGSGFDLYIVSPRGGRPQRVTSATGDERWPAWTPDGRLVFATRTDAQWDLAVVSIVEDRCPDDCPMTRLTDTPDDEREPAVSPDGGRIAFVSNRDNEDGDPDLWLLQLRERLDPGGRGARRDRDDSARRPVSRILRARGAEHRPSWAPDGSRIVYRADRDGVGSVWVAAVDAPADADGSVSRPKPPAPPLLVSRRGAQPAWSPDGTLLALVDVPSPDATYDGNPRRDTGERPPLFQMGAYRLRLLPAPLAPDEDSHAVPVGFGDGSRRWIAAFDRVWQTLWNLYYRSGPQAGVWQALRARLRPRAAEARDEPGFEDVVDELIAAQPLVKAPVISTGGAVVVSGHRLASEAGAAMLARGGNVVDAAIAVSVALGVVEPDASGLGGDGMALVYVKNMSTPAVVDFKDQVPSRATLDNPKIFREGRLVADGPAAANVPGMVAGLDLMYRRFGSGKLGWADLLAPAVTLAEEGFTLDEALPTTIAAGRGFLQKWGEAARIFLPGGQVPRPGDRFVNKDYAATLRTLGKEGAESFYRGSIARRIAEDLNANGGLIGIEDLAQYRALERTPLEGRYRGHAIFAAPPPVPSGAALIEVLQVLDRYPAATGTRYASDPDLLHYLIESWKVRDANRRIADPALWTVDLGDHLSSAHADALFQRIRPDRASGSLGDLDDRDVHEEDGQGPTSTDRIGRGTTALAVGDAAGNLVVVTQTLSTWGGTFYVSKGLGFLYNNHLRSNRTTRGAFGQLMPLARSASTSAPTLVFRRVGESRVPWFALAAAGNAWITASVYSMVSGIVDGGLGMQAAVEAPRLLVSRDPADPIGRAARIQIEDRFPRTVLGDLTGRGHSFQKIGRKGELRYGYAAGVLVDVASGRVEGGAEPRRSHAAVAAPPAASSAPAGR